MGEQFRYQCLCCGEEVYLAAADSSERVPHFQQTLLNCRSMREVWEHKKIDAPIKAFFLRDTFGLNGLYFAVAERRGPLDFLISDVYPTLITGTTVWGTELHMYSICPISPDRVILLVSNGVLGAPKSVVVV